MEVMAILVEQRPRLAEEAVVQVGDKAKMEAQVVRRVLGELQSQGAQRGYFQVLMGERLPTLPKMNRCRELAEEADWVGFPECRGMVETAENMEELAEEAEIAPTLPLEMGVMAHLESQL